jgi:RND superfamily putative drug exporter
MDETVNSVVLLIGLAVGVDYSLFYVRRAREERAAGRSQEASLIAAAATSGRAVLVSGVTVMIAVAGQYLAGSSVFTALATGSIIVVGVALLASLTVLPALLSLLGDRIERGRLPLIGRRRGESRVWGAVLTRVLRRPALSLALGTAVLVALAVPALGMHTALPGMDNVTDKVDVKPAYERIEAAFPGGSQPADVVVQARDVTTPEVQGAIAKLGRHVRVSGDRTVAAVEVPLPGDGTNDESVAALRELRNTTIPAAFAGVDGAKVDVAGVTAGNTDFADLMRERGPLVFAFVLGLAFVLMLWTFRSVVIPLKAIVLNLLSVGAAYGLLELVYYVAQDKPVTAWLPMFLFVVLFGLSMDYHVFIVSRIREAYDRGESTTDAVAHGIRSTAGVVTSAAAIMIAVFAVFGTLSSLDMQQMGVGLAAAVLIDATIVRGVLLPSAMALLGDWNWWMPGQSSRRPRQEVSVPSAA